MAGRPKDSTNTSVDASDPVDWARHFWRRQGLGDSEDAFIAMSSMLRMHRLMVDAIEAELRSRKLNVTDYMILMTLQLSETGTRLISQLARSVMIHATTATLATDRLEKRDLIARSPHPTDRRATMVSITPAGRKIMADCTDALRAIGFGLVGSTADDQRELVDLLARMRRTAGDADRPPIRSAR